MTLIKPERFVEDNEDVKIPKGSKETEEYLKILPKPVGYRLLVRPYSGKKKTKGGVYLSEKTQETIQMTTVVGLVVKMGDLCYEDKEKFPQVLGVKRASLLYMDDMLELDLKLNTVNTES